MEPENNDIRKRRSSVPSKDSKRKKLTPSISSMSHPQGQPKKLIDQLFETWKQSDSTNSPGSSTPKQKSELTKMYESQQAAALLKKSSVELKLSELNIEKAKFENKQRNTKRNLSFCLDNYNNVQKDVTTLYKDIQSMIEIQKSIDRQLNELDSARYILTQRLRQELDKKKEISSSFSNIEDSEIEMKNSELQKLEKHLAELKKENEEVEITDQDLSDLKKKLDAVKKSGRNLMDEEIKLNSILKEEKFQDLQDNLQHVEILETINREVEELEKKLDTFCQIDETLENEREKVKEILKKSNSKDFTGIDLTKKIHETQDKIKTIEFKTESCEKRLDLTKSLSILDSKLIEINSKSDSISSKNTEIKKLNEALIEVNSEINLLSKEDISDAIEGERNELEELNLQIETLRKENLEILHEIDLSDFTEEEKENRKWKLEIEQKKKIHSEVTNDYKGIEEKNNEYSDGDVDLSNSKIEKSIKELKVKIKADVEAAEKKEKSIKNNQQLKLKELEQKAKKIRNQYQELEQELNSEEKQFVDLEMQIKEAEEEFEGLKKTERENELRKEAELKRLKKEEELRKQRKEAELRKEAEFKKAKELKRENELKKLQREEELRREAEIKKEQLRKEAELKKLMKEAELKKLKKEAELRKAEELKKAAELKKQTDEKNKPSIVKCEKVNIDEETLSLIKTLKGNLSSLQLKKEVENSDEKSTQKAVGNPKVQPSPLRNSDKKSSQKITESSKISSPFPKIVESVTQGKPPTTSETLFDEIFSQFGSQKSQRTSTSLQIRIEQTSQKNTERLNTSKPFHKSSDDIYAFESSQNSQKSIKTIFSPFGSAKSSPSQKSNAGQEILKKKEDKKDNSEGQELSDVKSKQTVHKRSSERRFFRLSGRSKSLPPKKTK